MHLTEIIWTSIQPIKGGHRGYIWLQNVTADNQFLFWLDMGLLLTSKISMEGLHFILQFKVEKQWP